MYTPVYKYNHLRYITLTAKPIIVKFNNILSRSLIFSVISLFITLSSCHKSNPEDDDFIFPANLAVTKFALKNDTSVARNLDSVYFSVDLAHHVIYNADSLPYGTKITRLIPIISYSNKVTSATIVSEGGDRVSGNYDYMANPNDTIDFSGNVTLSLYCNNNLTRYDYKIKINVHKQKPDSIYWSELAVSTLPSRLPSPTAQKSSQSDASSYCFIQESDGTYTLSCSTDLYTGRWDKKSVTLPFIPQVRTFEAAGNSLYLLSDNGDLYSSEDSGDSWNATGKNWTKMLGHYKENITGIANEGNSRIFVQYPATGINQTVPADFPDSGMSDLVMTVNDWTENPAALLAGGVKADGSLTNATWGFDGNRWVKLSTHGIPDIKDAILIPYYVYRRYSSANLKRECFDVLLLTGGVLPDGTLNRKVYISYDNGITWHKGTETIQLPAAIPAMTMADILIEKQPANADLSDAWKIRYRSNRHKSPDYTLNDGVISWECPYLYMMGGCSADGTLYNTIWRGVLAQLTFTPLF